MLNNAQAANFRQDWVNTHPEDLADRSVTLFILINRSDKTAEMPSVANLVETLDDQTKSSKTNTIQAEAFKPFQKAASFEHGGTGRSTIVGGDG